MAKGSAGNVFWSVDSFPERIVDSLMYADRSGKVDERLRKVLPAYDEHYTFGLAESWDPRTELECDSNRIRRDVTSGPVVRDVVSDRLRGLIDRLAPDHAQWLPVTLVCRGRPLPWGPYWVANWTRKVDCWDRDAAERRMREAYRRQTGAELPRGKPLPRSWQPEVAIDPSRVPPGTEVFLVHGTNMLVVSNRIKAAIQRAKMTGWGFDPVALETGEGAAGDPSTFLVHLKVPAETPAPAPAAARRAKRGGAVGGEAYLRGLVGADMEVKVGKGATPQQIERFGRTLGVQLPAGYRRFLESCGHATIQHEEILGIGGAYDAEKATESMREWEELRWPKAMVVVAEDGRGGCYALDTAKMKNDECPVMYFDHELADYDEQTGRITPNFERCKPSFEAWLRAYGKKRSLLPY